MSKLSNLVELLDVILETYPEDAILAVADREKIIGQKTKIETRIQVGTPLNSMQGTVLVKALQAGKPLREERGPELNGWSYISSACPIIEDGEVTGVIAAIVKTEKLDTLREGATELSSTLQQLTATTDEIASSSQSISQQMKELEEEAQHMAQDIKSINTVLALVREIADQSHLLGLNAAIEAARAGEHGAGFGVVADEIRRMAEQSKTSAKEISEELKRVLDSIRKMNNIIKKVSENSEVQAERLQETHAAYNNIAGIADRLVQAAAVSS